MKNVVKLVPWVKVTKSFGDAGILRSRALHTNCRLGPLRACLDVSEVSGVADGPVVDLFVPLCNFLVLLELLKGDEVVDDHVLKLELIGQLVNRIVHVVAFPIKIFIDLSKLSISLLEPFPNLF